MKVKLISGTAHPELAEEISSILHIPLTPVKIKQFKDGEIYCRVLESVRGNAVFVIQPTSPNVNENLMELLILVDALRRASAKEINVIIPYFGYARQDRKARSREAISAKLVADMIETAGVDRVVTFDLHAGQEQGFFNIPTDNLEALPLFARYFLDKKLDDIVVVSPDVGGSVRANKLAKVLGANMAIIDKRRPKHNEAKIFHVIGDVKGKNAILLDDMIDSGGTIAAAAKKVKELGAKNVFLAATHPVFSPGVKEKLEHESIHEVIVANTIPVKDALAKVRVISVGRVLAEAIRRIYEAEPMGVLFDKMYAELTQDKLSKYK